MTLNSDYCTANCLFHSKNNTVQSCFFEKNMHSSSINIVDYTRPSSTTKKYYDIAGISAYAFIATAQKNDHQVIALWLKNFEELKAQDIDKGI